MREKYLKILGLDDNADEKAIKRAYFKLVRQHSPEKDPEQFQKIREAYEYLTSSQKNKEEAMEIPNDPLAKKLYGWYEEAVRKENYESAEEIAERALQIFDKSEAFLYGLYKAQSRLGKSGKAVKTMEKLAERYPDKMLYKRELAIAYLDRGYFNKAMAAFQDGYETGIRDLEFLASYAIVCQSRKQYRKGCGYLWEMLDLVMPQISAENIEYAFDAFVGLCMMSSCFIKTDAERWMEAFSTFVDRTEIYLNDYDEIYVQIVNAMVMKLCGNFDLDMKKIRQIIEKIQRILEDKERKEQLQEILDSLELIKLGFDRRISDRMKAFCYASSMNKEEMEGAKATLVEEKLFLLEEWPKQKPEFVILKEEYPQVFETVRDFLTLLEKTKDIERIRERLLKDYDRYDSQFEGMRYYREHPERRLQKENVQWDSLENGSYRRETKKIGRNDPCPCGSGKKYKNCCGRK